jgi:ADP-ribosylglycohydrolase
MEKEKEQALKRKAILDGIIGLCVGDALGVPVEFVGREELQRNPVTAMRGFGTYNLPPGTWSDDTSLALCLWASVKRGLDYHDIMDKFKDWLFDSAYTPHGIAFDCGKTTMEAIYRFANGTEPVLCGGSAETDNGNGSLMRILPLAFYLGSQQGEDYMEKEGAYAIIHDVSSLTHAHRRSHIACGIYLSIAGKIMESPQTRHCERTSKNFVFTRREAIQKVTLNKIIQRGLASAKNFYEGKEEYREELKHYGRIFAADFAALPLEAIKSSGYVVDTLEAALWCLLNTGDYQSAVLKAVNLGGDTDTVAAVAGGLAGLYYGWENIPGEWLGQIARLEDIKDICLD